LDSRADTYQDPRGQDPRGIRRVGTFGSGGTPLGYEFGDQIATFRDGARDDPLRLL
jgi:hypothetical protein